MYFIGIDLAWSKNNGSGIALLKGDSKKAELIEHSIQYSNENIITYISRIWSNNCIISIDAPLIVPNNEGRRPAEAEIGNMFRKYNAGAYPSNRKIFNSFYGGIRGEEISKLLEENGFKHNPYIKQYETTSSFFEVYPHPAMCVLFKLDKILKYKAKPKREYSTRYEGFDKLVENIKNLPDLIIDDNILNIDFRKLKSKKLKNFEDTLDGIFCAYLSYYVWKNPDKCKVFGDLQKGYIVSPVL